MLRIKQMTELIRTKPGFLVLLPVFFVLHGFSRNYDSVPVKDALLLTLIYLGSSLVIAGIFWLFYRDFIKAGLIAFLLMAYHFFFGSIQDGITNYLPGSFLLRYRFILPVSFLFFLAGIIWLKKRQKPLISLVFYLNAALLVIILVDAAWLSAKIAGLDKDKPFSLSAQRFSPCDTCIRPDVYFIIADQYTGRVALKEVFNFDNDSFQNELEARGFHIAKNSSSNYNLTPFSIASTLNMDYLELKKGPQNYESVGYSYQVIRNSSVLKFFNANHYQFFNCSIFDFDDHHANKYAAFLPYGIELITSQTFASRLESDFRPDILKGMFGETLQRKMAYKYLHFNDKVFERTRNIASQPGDTPKFIYTHLMMPHYPYYFDSKGNSLPLEKLSGIKKVNSHDYLEYLQYTNKKLLQLVDDILDNSPTPPLIMVLGDHGFRHPEIKTDRKYDFMNMNAVYFPHKNYSLFYDSISNVNEFRVIFNTYFGQHLPLLIDSSTNVLD